MVTSIHGPPMSPRVRRLSLGLTGLFVLALIVRAVGLDFDQGHFYHPDERAIGDAVLKLSFRPLQLNPHFFAYGSFPLYVTRAVSSGLAAVTGRPAFAQYDGVVHVGRFLSAVWGALTVLLLALLGRRWYGEKAGLLAGLLLALAVLHVQTSHFAATDVALTFMVLLALVCDSRLANRGRLRDALFAGAATGLALATKASAAPLLLPLAVAVFFATRDRRAFGRACALLAAAGAAALLAFALGEPYAFLDSREFWRSVTEQGAMVRHAGTFPFTHQYMGLPHFLYEGRELVLWGLGPLLGLAALWATARRLVHVRAMRPGEWILASFLVPYTVLTCTFEVKFPRYLLPIYPILLLWAGAWLSERAEKGLGGRVLRGAVVFGTAVWALAFLSIYTRPHSAVTASTWFHDRVPDGARVLEEDWDEGFPFSLPGRPVERYAVVQFPFYENDSPEKMTKLAGELARADWVVLQTKRLYGGVSRAPAKFPLTNRAFRLLFAGDLGFVLEKDVASRPSIFGIEVPDELADESFSVYDHPKALIFHNDRRLDSAELERRLLTTEPSKALSRNDLLLARAARPAGAAAGTAGPGLPTLRSSLAALVLFALLLELLGLAGAALVALVLPERPGLYALGKVLGVLFFGFGAWLLVSWRWASFGRGPLLAWAAFLLAAGWWASRARPLPTPARERAKTELVAWGAFLFFLAFRAARPEIWSGEKPMDFAFLNTLLRAETLPPPEPWLAGAPLSYTYFGHFVLAALGKLLGIHPGVLFNLGIAGVASLTACGVLAAGAALGGRLRTGAVAVLLTLFWAPTSGVREAVSRLTSGQPLDWHYFWATSRVIAPNAINEYPLWSFLFADLHAHVLAMPFTTAFLALLLFFVTRERPAGARAAAASVGLLGLLFAALQITNGWALPTYAGVLVFVPLAAFLGARASDGRPFAGGLARDVLLPALGASAAAWLLTRPFWAAFTPPPRNWGREVGPWASPWDFANVWAFFLALLVPFLFVVLRRGDPPPSRAGRVLLALAACALPLSLLSASLRPPRLDQAASAGFFTGIACLVGLAASLARGTSPRWRLAAILATFGLATLTGCEIVYVWDRMNTVFKFHLETWFLFALAGAVALEALVSSGGTAWKAAVAATGAVAAFTVVTAVPGYLRLDRGSWPRGTLDGTAYLEEHAPADRAAYEWINANVKGIPVLLEAQGPAYQEFSRYAMNTGLPTVQGWEYHTQQRGHSQAETDRRKADVAAAYTSADEAAVAAILRRYHVALVAVGPLERKTYGGDILGRFAAWTDLLAPVYRNPEVTLFAVKGVYAAGGTATLVRVEELPASAPSAGAPAAEPPAQPAGQVRQPRGVAADAKGRLWVADFGNNRIQAFSPDLKPLVAFGSHGSAPGAFKDPCGVAVGPDGLVYVADTWNGRVQVFDDAGTFRREFSGDFFGPRGIAVDAGGRVFVADTGNGRIMRFDPAGRRETDWGKADGAGRLAGPNGLALAPDGHVWVADNDNGRAACFTADGAFVRAFTVPGWRREIFSEPYVAVDAKGVVWVSVPLAGEIRGYAADGTLLATARGKDQPEGQRFEKPSGLALLPAGRLAVADLEGRIVVIRLPK
jgi:YYY domain-containing protein